MENAAKMINIGPFKNAMIPREMAVYINRDPESIYTTIKQLQIPHLYIAGKMYCLKDEIDTWLQKQVEKENQHRRVQDSILRRA